MSLAPKSPYITEAEYLAGEQRSETRHEYVEGRVYAMAGASVNHNRISRNLLTCIAAGLPESCEVFSADLMVRTAAKRYRYPDLLVCCDEETQGKEYYIEHPLLIIEILSGSTRRQDKGAKRTEYLSMPSLQEYMLVEQDFVEVEVLRRSRGWQPENYYLGDCVRLASIDVELPVSEIYQRVDNADMAEYRAK